MADRNESIGRAYADRDVIQLDRDGEYYMRHVAAMTREGLHSKSDIAAELAWRDREIDRLRKELREQGEPVLAERVRKLDRQAPGEWVMVPREPTEAMIEAAEIREDEEPLGDWGKIVPAPHDEIYKAMLAAAPQPPAPRVTQAMVDDQRQTVEELRSIRDRIPQPPAQEQGECVRHECRRVRIEMQAEIDRLRAAGAEDAERLEWISKHWGGQRQDYAAHILRRGGTGDLSDIRSYVDSAIAAQEALEHHRPASPEEQRSLDEALGLETVTFRMPRALHKQVVAEAAEAGLIVPAYIRYRLKTRADAVYERIVRRLVETPEGCIELARVIHRELDHVSTLIHAAIDRAQADTKKEE